MRDLSFILIDLLIIILLTNISSMMTSLVFFQVFIFFVIFIVFLSSYEKFKFIKINYHELIYVYLVIHYVLVGSFFSQRPIKQTLGIINSSIIFLLLLIVFIIHKKFIDKAFFSKSIIFSGLFLVLLGILEYFDILILTERSGRYIPYTNDRIGSLWINPNSYGLILSWIATFYVQETEKPKLSVLILLFIGVLLSQSRSSIIYYLFILYVYLKKENKNKNFLGLSVMVVMFVFLKKNFSDLAFLNRFSSKPISNDGRIHLAKESLAIIYSDFSVFLLGMGFGGLAEKTVSGQSAHNMIIGIHAEVGIIGLILYLMCLLSTLRHNKKNGTPSYFIYLLYFSFFNHNLIIYPTFLLSVFLSNSDVESLQ